MRRVGRTPPQHRPRTERKYLTRRGGPARNRSRGTPSPASYTARLPLPPRFFAAVRLSAFQNPKSNRSHLHKRLRGGRGAAGVVMFNACRMTRTTSLNNPRRGDTPGFYRSGCFHKDDTSSTPSSLSLLRQTSMTWIDWTTGQPNGAYSVGVTILQVPQRDLDLRGNVKVPNANYVHDGQCVQSECLRIRSKPRCGMKRRNPGTITLSILIVQS